MSFPNAKIRVWAATMSGALILALAPVASARNVLNNIPLQWRPTSEISASVPEAQLRAKITVTPFTDLRSDAALIAENREDAEKGVILPVTTAESVPEWVTGRVRFILSKLGYQLVDQGADVVLSGAIQRFFVTETGTYEGDVQMTLKLTGANAVVLWQGDSAGAATRFGRSYKAENYYEVLSDSLIDLVLKLTTHMSFANALMNATGPAPVP